MTEPTPTSRELFEAALALAPGERAGYLDTHCVDPAQCAAVERLLAADTADEGRLLDRPFDELLGRVSDSGPESSLPASGARVGPFTLIEKLGEGGSSVVFRAMREQAGVRQTVALKLLRHALCTEDERRRFRDERRALAQLRHPGIARLIEGGLTDAGMPYIALELIDGVAITEHVRERHLDLRSRLTLFVDVCRAVAAAHRALIVHRDLKPSNVLVTHEGEVKLLDFGIAKLLDAGEDATRTQHQALTPAYAAPEQFNQGQITTATDVYALGVLLGELITGQRREHGDLHTPSSRISDDTDPNALPAPPRTTRRLLRGDLDNIVLKATDAEPERRYASAGAFADDIERHLARQPVVAHPPSQLYRARKFVARHRGGVAITALFLLAIVTALATALWQANVARQQANLARHEAQRANTVRDFVEDIFEPLRYGVAEGKQPSLDELLARGLTHLDNSPQLGAGERVDLLAMFSRLYENLGEVPRSRELASQAVALAERALPPSDLNAIRALSARGYAAVRAEDYAAGAIDLREAHRRMLAAGIHGEALIDLLEPLGAVESIEGHDETSLELSREALAERIATWGPDDHRVGVGYNDLASALEGVERYDEAVRTWRQTYAFQLAHLGPDSNETTLAMTGWASAEYRAGHWGAAHDLFARALAMYARNGGKPQVTQVYAAQKACILEGLREDRADALDRCKLARELSATGFGADSALHGDSLESTAFGHVELGDIDTARREFEKARKLYGDAPANRMRNGRADSELAGIALLEGDPASARKRLPGAISGLRTRAYKIPPLIAEARLLLACAQSPGPECPGDLRATVERDLAEVATRDNPELLTVHTILARLELQRGDAGAARARLAAALERASHELPPAHPRRIAAQLWLAVAEVRAGDCLRAVSDARAARDIIAANDLAAHPLLVAARAALRETTACGTPLD